ncbi:HDOD domain-containing protein [Massilia sp. B-10]|nr:HDOD domain-containing protein [Massilia sp. B-10]
MTLLGLLARDAETRELEALLKQDPALSYHLLKLANSAAFSHSADHQLRHGDQRIGLGASCSAGCNCCCTRASSRTAWPTRCCPWQLRAAHMEALCKLDGGERDDQDLAFMTGVFSLLDMLFAMPMEEIVGTLNLPPLAADALLTRTGRFGEMLRLAEGLRDGPDARRGQF